mmetsp:Transcript_24881/g.49944  ORF Transcript_24881/g.49944 Transcript_24881/m.49944 type:complete len:161 (+) Transcript_24881:50-532(+)
MVKFRPVTIPISIVLASAYVWYVTRNVNFSGSGAGGKSKGKQFKDVEINIHQKAPSCRLRAQQGDLLHLHYSGYATSTGKLFESSRESSEPYVFKLGACHEQGKVECLLGFQKGVTGMCVGEKRKVTIPAHLAYGEEGRGAVPPNVPVLFHVELVDIDRL